MTAAWAVRALLGGLLTPAFFIVTGRLVETVPQVARDGFASAPGRRMIMLLVLAAALFVASQVIEQAGTLLGLVLGRRLDIHLRERVMRALLRPTGISHLEDPALLDEVSLARGVGPGDFTPGGAVSGFGEIIARYVTGGASAILVARSWWWLAVLLVAGHVITRRRLRADISKIVDVAIGRTDSLRRASYFRDLALGPGAAKELRIFGLRAWVGDRFRQHWLSAMGEVWRERSGGYAAYAWCMALMGLLHTIAFGVIAHAAIQGDIGIGTIAVLSQAIMGMFVLGNPSNADLDVAIGVAAVPHALALESRLAGEATTCRDAEAACATGEMPLRDITFAGIGFRYPGQNADVYRELDLVVPAGKSLAIVGPNGAGKTTLVKLLARLYEPSAGRISIDGVDLRDLDAREWRRRIAVIFQDFVQYALSARDNVGWGAIERADDLELVRAAARRVGIAEAIEALPKGWDTVLSRQFTDGADLSGGQWQRVALARALFAVSGGASVLVLDEPTANLDVRAEAELFDQFLDLTRGLTTILVSHRFSTVRRADRIAVLEHGRVTEQGTHDELIARDGAYARMFRLQAGRFSDTPAAEPSEAGA